MSDYLPSLATLTSAKLVVILVLIKPNYTFELTVNISRCCVIISAATTFLLNDVY